MTRKSTFDRITSLFVAKRCIRFIGAVSPSLHMTALRLEIEMLVKGQK